MKKFTIKCNKCGSEDVVLFPNHDYTILLVCNECGESELDEDEQVTK